MRKTKVTAILLMLMFALTFIAPATFASNLNDLTGHWAEAQIKALVDQGFISGYPDGSFKPEGKITRAEFAAIIVKGFNLNGGNGKVFADTAQHWGKNSIATANHYGIVNGYSDTRFGPNDPITREQMAVMVVKAAKLTGSASNKTFADSQNISEWAKSSVALAVGNNIISGYPDNTFKPKGNATRAEAAVVLNKSTSPMSPPIIRPTEYESIDKAGTHGPATGTKTVSGNVTVKAQDTILQNLVIKGDLIIAKEVGSGNVTLNNIKVEGKTYIRGGGKDSIHINGGIYNEVIVEKTATGALRILAIKSPGLQITIAEDTSGGEIILSGEFKKVTVKAGNVKIVTQGHTVIGELEVQSGLNNVNIELSRESTVQEMVLNSKANVTGKGIIWVASGSKAKDSKFATEPDKITTDKPAAVGGGGGGGGGGGTPTPAKEITAYTPLTAVTLGADEHLVDLAALKASGKLPTKVKVTDGTKPVDATITDWTGTFDGKTTGTKTLTAKWTMPAGYVDAVSPIIVTVDVKVDTAQTEGEITDYTPLTAVTLASDEHLVDLAALKANGRLPTTVEVIAGATLVDAAITDWTGTFDGKITGTKTLTATWTLPAGYVDEIEPIDVKLTVNVSIAQTDVPKEITGHTPLTNVTLDADEHLVNLAALKASGKLPTTVEVTDGITPATATITDWKGTFDGKIIGTYNLTIKGTLPAGYVDKIDPIVVTVDVKVNTAQTEGEITGYTPLTALTLNENMHLVDLAALKASGKLPTTVEAKAGATTVDVTITDWIGTFDGKTIDTYILKVKGTLPPGYVDKIDPIVVTVDVVVDTAQTEAEITGYTPLTALTLNADEHLVDLAALKASGKLPTKVKVTDGTTTVDATITDWTGTFDGKITGTKTLTAAWTLPAGYVDAVSPITVTVAVVVNTAQTEAEITGYALLADVRLDADEHLVDLDALKASGELPTTVKVTDGTTFATATITGWTGAFDGKTKGTTVLKAVWSPPAGYVDEVSPLVVTIDVVVNTAQTAPKEITGFIALTTLNLNADEHLVDLDALKASGKLPTTVKVTDGTTTVDAEITDWTGTFDGKTTGTKKIKAVWTMPVGYVDKISPINVELTVKVNKAQTLALKEITGTIALNNVDLDADEHLVDLIALKASGKLPTTVTVTDGTTFANATITGWTGIFDGTTTGIKTITATWTPPAGYADEIDPINVELTVNVNEAQTIPLTEIAAISGTAKAGVELTAGALTPAGATVSYQWTKCDTVDGTYETITGATSNKYTPLADDVGKYIKVTATGTGNYSGTVTSTATAAVAPLDPSTIVFADAGPVAKTVGDPPFINTATGDGDGTITYTSDTPATATVDETTGAVTIVAAGSAVITATQAESATHAAGTATYTLNVTLTPSTIVFNDAGPIEKRVGDAAFTNTATGDGAGTITYTSDTPATATVDETTGAVTIVAAGSAVITATQAESATHAAGTATYTLNVSAKD